MKNQNYKAILYNRYVLYFILLLSLVNLYSFAIIGQYVYVIIFVLVGYLTYFFSKNMMVILFTAIVITNILKYGKSISLERNLEGLENIDESENQEDHEGPEHQTEEQDYVGADEPQTNELEYEFLPSEQPVDSILGIDKKLNEIGNIENNTASLLETQKELMDNMKSLEPMLQNANQILSKFENFQN